MAWWYDAHDASLPVEIAPGAITPNGTIRITVYAKQPEQTERGAYIGAIEVTADDLRTMLSGLEGARVTQPARVRRRHPERGTRGRE
jgi:hypothetical protein